MIQLQNKEGQGTNHWIVVFSLFLFSTLIPFHDTTNWSKIRIY